MEKIKGNVDSSYELRKDEANRVHVRTVKRVHVPAEERYDNIIDVRKFWPQQHNTNLKIGFYNQYSSTEVLHDPEKKVDEKVVAEDNGKTAKELREDFKTLTGEEAPKVSKAELQKLVSEKEAELTHTITEDYKNILGEEAKDGLTVYEMIEAINEKIA